MYLDIILTNKRLFCLTLHLKIKKKDKKGISVTLFNYDVKSDI